MSDNKQLLEKLSELFNTVNLSKDSPLFIVFGGVAVDAYAGKLTRPHPDVDFITFEENFTKVAKIIEGLGYPTKLYEHHQEKGLHYKLCTEDNKRTFTWQIATQLSDIEFEISFYRYTHLYFPMTYLQPNWITLEGLDMPIVSKLMLIELKEKEVAFYDKLKTDDPEKYFSKWEKKHQNCIHDLGLLKK